MSAIDPTQAQAALQGLGQAAQTLEPAAVAALAITDPQAAAVLQAADIGVKQLTAMTQQLQQGGVTAEDVEARATQIASAIASTRAAWDALNKPLPSKVQQA